MIVGREDPVDDRRVHLEDHPQILVDADVHAYPLAVAREVARRGRRRARTAIVRQRRRRAGQPRRPYRRRWRRHRRRRRRRRLPRHDAVDAIQSRYQLLELHDLSRGLSLNADALHRVTCRHVHGHRRARARVRSAGPGRRDATTKTGAALMMATTTITTTTTMTTTTKRQVADRRGALNADPTSRSPPTRDRQLTRIACLSRLVLALALATRAFIFDPITAPR